MFNCLMDGDVNTEVTRERLGEGDGEGEGEGVALSLTGLGVKVSPEPAAGDCSSAMLESHNSQHNC